MQSFENLSNSRSESYRAIVGGVGAVTLLRNRLNKCMLPRRRISARNKNEAKKTTKDIPLGLWPLLEERSEIPIVLLFLLCCWLPPKLGKTAKVYR